MANNKSKNATSASAWKKKKLDDTLDLPSGNTARVRRIGPESFLAKGLVPDSLTPIVEEAIRTKKGLKPQKAKKMAEDPESLSALMEMIDHVCVEAVIEPDVTMPPGCTFVMPDGQACGEYDNSRVKVHQRTSPDYHKAELGERDEEALYADEVDMDDKVFIMNFAIGGTSDLQRFRQEQQLDVAGLSNGQALEDQAV